MYHNKTLKCWNTLCRSLRPGAYQLNDIGGTKFVSQIYSWFQLWIHVPTGTTISVQEHYKEHQEQLSQLTKCSSHVTDHSCNFVGPASHAFLLRCFNPRSDADCRRRIISTKSCNINAKCSVKDEACCSCSIRITLFRRVIQLHGMKK